MPVSFPEYVTSSKNSPIKPSPTKPSEWTDLVTELTDITAQVLKQKIAGTILSRDEVYDKVLHQKRLRLIEELKHCPAGLCDVLKETIKYGIAYHHSGLTNDEKLIVEKGYRTGILYVLVATSTLSTGINLPAKAVIFKTPLIAKSFIDCAKYKQKSGRAGRTGFDTRGDVVIVTANQQQLKHTRNVLLQPFTAKLSSALNGSRLVRSLLEIISACAVESLKELSQFIQSTLVYQLAKEA